MTMNGLAGAAGPFVVLGPAASEAEIQRGPGTCPPDVTHDGQQVLDLAYVVGAQCVLDPPVSCEQPLLGCPVTAERFPVARRRVEVALRVDDRPHPPLHLTHDPGELAGVITGRVRCGLEVGSVASACRVEAMHERGVGDGNRSCGDAGS